MTKDDNVPSFKYKTGLITNTETDETINGVKIAVSVKCMNTFWRSLETPLINCKVELSLRLLIIEY